MTNRANPQWTEGVCADGAVFLRDGVPVPITEVVKALNDAEDMKVHFTEALCDAVRAAAGILRKGGT